MTEPNEMISPPVTGNITVDNALRALADLASAPLSEHHDRLGKAHEALHEALDAPDDQSEHPQPR